MLLLLLLFLPCPVWRMCLCVVILPVLHCLSSVDGGSWFDCDDLACHLLPAFRLLLHAACCVCGLTAAQLQG